MESLSLAISAPPELPRSKMRSTAMTVSGRAKSRATRRRTYSARDTPSSLARWRARRCTSFSSVIWVRDIMMATSYHCSVPRLRFNLGVTQSGTERQPALSASNWNCCNRYHVDAFPSRPTIDNCLLASIDWPLAAKVTTQQSLARTRPRGIPRAGPRSALVFGRCFRAVAQQVLPCRFPSGVSI